MNKIEYSKEWIDSIPKIIDKNGCWIPTLWTPGSTGRVHFSSEGSIYLLHRLSMCIIYDIDYKDQKIVARHNSRCDKRCFYYKHLQPGTDSDNEYDKVRDGTHRQTQKKYCSKCGGEYKTKITKTGWSKGQIHRYCPICKAMHNYKRYHS